MKKKRKTPTYNLTIDQIEQMKKEAAKSAVATAYKLLMYNAIMVIEGHFSELIRKEVDGKNRIMRFVEMLVFQFECWDEDYISIRDMQKYIKDECGVYLDVERKGNGIRVMYYK